MKMFLTSFALAVSFAIGAISSQAETRIGVAIYKYDNHFMTLMRQDIQQEANQLKGAKLLMNDSQNAQSIQNKQVDKMIARGVKALAINLVDPAAGATILNKAREKNLPVVFFNRAPNEALLNRYDKAYYVGADPNMSGNIQGELIAKHWKANPQLDRNQDGKIQYALLKGEPWHPDTIARSQAVIDTLHQQGLNTEQLMAETGMWETGMAKEKVNAWLSSAKADDIEVIIANNDAMAIGALAATKTHDKTLPIFGIDALPEALQLIKQGELAGTVRNDSFAQSQAVVRFAHNLANGKPVTDGTNWTLENKVLNIPYVGVDKTNLSEFLK